MMNTKILRKIGYIASVISPLTLVISCAGKDEKLSNFDAWDKNAKGYIATFWERHWTNNGAELVGSKVDYVLVNGKVGDNDPFSSRMDWIDSLINSGKSVVDAIKIWHWIEGAMASMIPSVNPHDVQTWNAEYDFYKNSDLLSPMLLSFKRIY